MVISGFRLAPVAFGIKKHSVATELCLSALACVIYEKLFF